MEAVSDTRTSTLRLPASDRRRQLVETALDFFSRKGFGGTTTKEIAAAAGVTEAIIFRHFPTKSDLYNAVLDHHHDSGRIGECIAQWQSCMDRNDDEGLVRAIIEKIIESYRRDLRGHRVLLFAALEGHEVPSNTTVRFRFRSLSCCASTLRAGKARARYARQSGRHRCGRRRHGHPLRNHDADVRLLREFGRSTNCR